MEKAILEEFDFEKALSMEIVEPQDYIWKYLLLKEFKNDKEAAIFTLFSAPKDNEFANLLIAKSDPNESSIEVPLEARCETLKKIGEKISEDFFVNKYVFKELGSLDSLGTREDALYIIKNIWNRDENLLRRFFLYIEYRIIDLKTVIRELEFLAKKKYGNAMYLLGHAYLVGYGVEVDLEKSLEYFWGAYKYYKFGMAMLGLGKILLTEDYRNYPNAIQSLKFVQASSAEAKYYLSLLTEQTENKSFEEFILLKHSALSGYLPAVYAVAVEYIKQGHFESANYSLQSVTQFHPFFLKYDSMALDAYLSKNYRKSLLIYLMLSKFNLKNPIKNALKLMEERKILGNQDDILFRMYSYLAQTDQNYNAKLGDLYLEGRGVEKSSVKAFACYLAAKKYSSTAAYNCAWMYEHGIGVPQNLIEAARIVKKYITRDSLYLVRFYALLRIYAKIVFLKNPIPLSIIFIASTSVFLLFKIFKRVNKSSI